MADHCPEAGGIALLPGTLVRLCGLGEGAAVYNGKEGVCEHWDSKVGMMTVRLANGEAKSVRTVRLRRARLPLQHQVPGHPDASRLKQMFRKYDVNGDGAFDAEDIRSVIKCLGTDGICIGPFMNMVDVSGAGVVDYEDFVDWVLAEHPPQRPKWDPSAQAPGDADDLEQDGDGAGDSPRHKDMTVQDVLDMCGEVPYGWPDHGVRVLGNMRRRFPDLQVPKIVQLMRKGAFHGGEVIQLIRRTGAPEVDVLPAAPVRSGGRGCGQAFPADYTACCDAPIGVFEDVGQDFTFRNAATGRLKSVAQLQPGATFRVLEARRDLETGEHFGRVALCVDDGPGEDRKLWVCMGADVSWDPAAQVSRLHFEHASRLEESQH